MNGSAKTYWTEDRELVERYVLGKISPEEKKRLDDEIADCEPCQQMLLREMQIAAGIKSYGRSALKSRLRSKLRRKQYSQTNAYHLVGLAAAVVVFAVSVGIYQLWFRDIETPKRFGTTEIVLPKPEPEQDEKIEDERLVAEEQSLRSGATSDSQPKKLRAADKPAASASKSGRGEENKKQDAVAALSETASSAPSSPSASSERPEPILKVGKSIWLLGSIEMITDAKNEISDKDISRMAKEKTVGKVEQKKFQQKRSITVQRREGNEEIVIQQRSFRDLPRSRQTQMGRSNRVESLLEQNPSGLSITIFSDALSHDEIVRATIETPSADSLIVITASHRIVYRLPSEALYQQRSRR